MALNEAAKRWRDEIEDTLVAIGRHRENPQISDSTMLDHIAHAAGQALFEGDEMLEGTE